MESKQHCAGSSALGRGKEMCSIERDEHGACTVALTLGTASTQLSTSACGPTALLDVLHALGFTHVTPEQVLAQVPARLRDYGTQSLEAYLLSRARAGTTHVDLTAGVGQLSGGKAIGRLFSPHPLTSPHEFGQQLAVWIAAGAVPLLTLNLFLEGQDAWHHQVVSGVTLPPKGVCTAAGSTHSSSSITVAGTEEVYCSSIGGLPHTGTGSSLRATEPVLHLLNPRCKERASHILPRVTSPPFMAIPHDHVAQRLMQLAMAGGMAAVHQLAQRLQTTEPWAALNVGQQVMRIFMSLMGQSASEDEEEEEEDVKEVQPLPNKAAASTSVPTPPASKQSQAGQSQPAHTIVDPQVQDGAGSSKGETQMTVAGPGTASPASHAPKPQLLATQPHSKKQQRAAFAGHTRFDDLVIPWGGLSGVTLFVAEGSVAYAELVARPTKCVLLPLYNLTTSVCMDMTPPTAACVNLFG